MYTLESINQETSKIFDCLECGQKNSVSISGPLGYCLTPGCLYHESIQFVYVPHWSKPKVSRAGRELWLNK
ncbi:hypothetical protein [Hazenella coriacea]|uniref:Uncharacterized protein n=1 Tax=Hazenella coriacea TaxID=1179467 RepID=A0A4R3L9A9_9BACL|nr:hypothetical protein [Hazenella coriacea]TCS95685.1 hypothetical protein EDD58_102261 [Hazenella coriacea]